MEHFNGSTNPDQDETGDTILRHSLLILLQEYLSNVEDFYENLLANYDTTTYDKFEWMFIKIRYEIKSMLMSLEDPYYRYILRSENRKQTVTQILLYATEVASWFQNARETGRLDRSQCTNSIENLLYAIKNLYYLVSN